MRIVILLFITILLESHFVWMIYYLAQVSYLDDQTGYLIKHKTPSGILYIMEGYQYQNNNYAQLHNIKVETKNEMADDLADLKVIISMDHKGDINIRELKREIT